jgi:cytochrome bd-type quinol oxidase subunit 2
MAIATNRKVKKKKIIFYLSVIILFYFIAVLLMHELKYDNFVIGVFRELLTLPFLALLIVLLVLSIVSLIKEKFIINSYPFFSLVILLITAVLLILKS